MNAYEHRQNLMKNWISSISAILLLALLIGGCAAPPKPLTANERDFGESEDEATLIRRSEEYHLTIAGKGLILPDEDVQAYVRGVAAKVLPDEAAGAARFRFFVLRDPVINAFALPNGHIYVNLGLLSRLENEAQLAHILAHEISHVVYRHGLKTHRDARRKIITGHVADLMLFGTSIAYLPVALSLASYSREQETEADIEGLKLLAKAGYRLDAAPRVFEILSEVKNAELARGSIFSSHPDNQKRISYIGEKIGKGEILQQADAVSGEERYLAVQKKVILQTIRLKLNRRLYELTRDSIRAGLMMRPDDPWLYYYEGESYRRAAADFEGAAREHAWLYGEKLNQTLISRFEKDREHHLKQAKEAYLKALGLDAAFPEAYRGLGLVAFEEGENDAARDYLKKYLAGNKKAGDRRYIERLLEKIWAAQ